MSDIQSDAIFSFGFTLFFFVYLICWFYYLLNKHYGSARAAHIFEFNILLDLLIFIGILLFECGTVLLFPDSGYLCGVTQASEHVATICYYSSIAGSHVETLLFLKEGKHFERIGSIFQLFKVFLKMFLQNLSADTMTTNTAAWICIGLKVIAVMAGLSLVWAFPESRLCSSSLFFCEYFHPTMFYFYSLPFILIFIIVLGVVGFTMYRAHTFVSIPPQDEHNGSTPVEIVCQEILQNVIQEDDLSTISLGHFNSNESLNITCQPPVMIQNLFPPLFSMLDVLYKYLRVSLLSLCLLAVTLPEHIMIIIAFTTKSGCESEQFVQAVDYILMPNTMIVALIVPYLVKRKMDRFSE